MSGHVFVNIYTVPGNIQYLRSITRDYNNGHKCNYWIITNL